jgi:single-strand DNA-binding protein
VFNDRIGEVVEKYVRKGSKVYVEGSLQTRKWTDQSGQEKYTTEVVIGKFRGELTMLDTRSGGGDAMGEGGGGYSRERAPAAARAPARVGAGAGAGGGSAWEPARGGDLDDEIPF